MHPQKIPIFFRCSTMKGTLKKTEDRIHIFEKLKQRKWEMAGYY